VNTQECNNTVSHYLCNGNTLIIYDSINVTNACIPFICNDTAIVNVIVPQVVLDNGISTFLNSSMIQTVILSYNVVNISANAFQGFMSPKYTIILLNSIISIGDNAFENTNLSSIVLQDSVISIGKYAFANTMLTSISIPRYVTSIGQGAFANCSYMNSIYFDPNIQITKFSDYLFYGTPLYSIVIPNTVTTIGERSFENTLLNSINIFSITDIGAYAFANCSFLTSIVINVNVTTIKRGTFYNNTRLKSITFGINSSLQTIGRNAFENCTNILSISIPDNVKVIDDNAFSNCVNVTSIGIGSNSSLQTIGKNAFMNCVNLTTFTIPKNITLIDDYAFANCSNIYLVTINANCSSNITYGIELFQNNIKACYTSTVADTQCKQIQIHECPYFISNTFTTLVTFNVNWGQFTYTCFYSPLFQSIYNGSMVTLIVNTFIQNAKPKTSYTINYYSELDKSYKGQNIVSSINNTTSFSILNTIGNSICSKQIGQKWQTFVEKNITNNSIIVNNMNYTIDAGTNLLLWTLQNIIVE
jgi:hypothetical protein